MCIHCVWKVLRSMEEEAGLVGAREFPARNPDWFDGGVTFTKAYALRLRAALEGQPSEEDRDTQMHPKNLSNGHRRVARG